jgi:hypothetical protein
MIHAYVRLQIMLVLVTFYSNCHVLNFITLFYNINAMDWCDEVYVMIASTYRYHSVKTLVLK